MTSPERPRPAATSLVFGLGFILVAAILVIVAGAIAPAPDASSYYQNRDHSDIVLVFAGLAALLGSAQFLIGLYRLVDGFDRAALRAHRADHDL